VPFSRSTLSRSPHPIIPAVSRRRDVADGGHGFRGDEEQGVGEGDADSARRPPSRTSAARRGYRTTLLMLGSYRGKEPEIISGLAWRMTFAIAASAPARSASSSAGLCPRRAFLQRRELIWRHPALTRNFNGRLHIGRGRVRLRKRGAWRRVLTKFAPFDRELPPRGNLSSAPAVGGGEQKEGKSRVCYLSHLSYALLRIIALPVSAEYYRIAVHQR